MNALRIILLSPIAILRLILVLLITAFIGITGWLWLKIFGFSRKLQYWSMHTWGKWNMFILGVRSNHNPIPAEQNFILMPNHRSYLDIFIVAHYTPAAMVGKAELKKWPFLKLGAKLTNSIFVSRQEMKSLIQTMHKIQKSVEQGIPVIIFPEGTTSTGPFTKSFKSGSFKIAAETGIKIIPMAIHFEDEKDSWVNNDTFVGHFLRQMGKPITKVRIRYGNPIVNHNYKILQQETKSQIDLMIKDLSHPGRI